MKKLKIAMLTPDYYPNPYAGVGVHVHSLVVNLLKQFDIDITVIVLRCEIISDKMPKLFEEPKGVKVIEFTSDRGENIIDNKELDYFTYRWTINNIRAIEYLSEHIAEMDFNLIHCHDLFPVWIMDLLRRKLNIPVISSIHGRAADQLRIEDSLRGYVCRTSNYSIAVSGHLKDELIERYGELPNMEVIYNGVSKSKSSYEGEKEKYFTYCGRIASTKGVDILIKAFSEFVNENDDYKDFTLKIIGDGECKEKCIELCEKLNMKDKIQFTSYIPNEEARDLIKRASIHFVPSLYESFATSALEAMEEGTFVIASSVGGLQEMIEMNETGILVEPGNIEELKLAIKTAMSDIQFRKRIEIAAKKKVQKYWWENIAKDVMELYQKCLSQ